MTGTDARMITLDELDEIEEGDPVWLEMRACSWPQNACITAWVLFKGIIDVGTDYLWFFGNLQKPNPLGMKESDYGLEWRCWTGRPTGEQIEGAKWDG